MKFKQDALICPFLLQTYPKHSSLAPDLSWTRAPSLKSSWVASATYAITGHMSKSISFAIPKIYNYQQSLVDKRTLSPFQLSNFPILAQSTHLKYQYFLWASKLHRILWNTESDSYVQLKFYCHSGRWTGREKSDGSFSFGHCYTYSIRPAQDSCTHNAHDLHMWAGTQGKWVNAPTMHI